MDTVKSLRIPDDLLRAIRDRAKRERLDESAAIRQLIGLGAAEHAVRLYRDGAATLNEAAEVAGVTPRDMIDLLLDHGVRGNVTLEQQRTAIAHALGKP